MSELIDNREERIRTLKQVIKGLHEGEDPERVKSRLKSLVRECDASEIAAMEQQLMSEGVPVKQIMGMCDLHSQVVHDLLVERPHAPLKSGHPVDVFRRENAALVEKSAALRSCFADLTSSSAGDAIVDADGLRKCRDLFNELMDVDKHYSRKENLLFPMLERYGITGPSKVMWAKDDEVRGLMRGVGESAKKKRFSCRWHCKHSTSPSGARSGASPRRSAGASSIPRASTVPPIPKGLKFPNASRTRPSVRASR
jgi:DUF438 domain-containing protein